MVCGAMTVAISVKRDKSDEIARNRAMHSSELLYTEQLADAKKQKTVSEFRTLQR